MKKMMTLAVFIIGGFMIQSASAQLKVNVNLNIGSQPVWGPTGYDQANYYYLPDIDCYYDVNRQQFVYQNGGRWAFASQLPARYHFDLYNGYKVVVNDPKPWMHPDVYRTKYKNHPHEKQMVIRDSREEKYYQVKGHPMHDQWAKNHHDDHHDDHGRH